MDFQGLLVEHLRLLKMLLEPPDFSQDIKQLYIFTFRKTESTRKAISSVCSNVYVLYIFSVAQINIFTNFPWFQLAKMILNPINALHKKWGLPLRISSVNVTKSAVSCVFGHIYWRNPWLKTFFVQWWFLIIICDW